MKLKTPYSLVVVNACSDEDCNDKLSGFLHCWADGVTLLLCNLQLVKIVKIVLLHCTRRTYNKCNLYCLKGLL